MYDDSGDYDDDEAGQQRGQHQATWWDVDGSSTDITCIFAAARGAGGSAGRRRDTVLTQRQRLVHLQTTRYVHCTDLVDKQLLAHVCAQTKHHRRLVISRKDSFLSTIHISCSYSRLFNTQCAWPQFGPEMHLMQWISHGPSNDNALVDSGNFHSLTRYKFRTFKNNTKTVLYG